MAEHGNEIGERGFVDELVDMLVANPFRSEEDDIGEFLRDEETPFNVGAFIDTLGRETISSEPRVTGDFTERLPKGSEFSMAQFFAEAETTNIGDDIVLSSILKQLNLPSASMQTSSGAHVFPGIDIVDFVDPTMSISRLDLAHGQVRKERSNLFNQGI